MIYCPKCSSTRVYELFTPSGTNRACSDCEHRFFYKSEYKLERESEEGALQDIKNPPRFQDLNYCFLERISLAMLEGYDKYEKDLIDPTIKNYMKADLKFALGRIGNAIKHLLLYNEQILASLRKEEEINNDEDHLGHAAANLNMLAKWEEMGLLPSTKKVK